VAPTRTASAGPQFSLGVLAGGSERLDANRSDFGFWLGTRADLWLLRTRDADWGFGPTVEAWTSQFDDLHAGGGVSLLAPLWPAVPFVLSAGPSYDFTRRTPEATLELFWGPSSYNFHGSYALTNGLFARVTQELGGSSATRITLGVRVDLALFALPFVLAYEALRPTP
jgi:hypothetical protein